MNVAIKMATQSRAPARPSSEIGPIFHDLDSEPPENDSDEERTFFCDEEVNECTCDSRDTITP